MSRASIFTPLVAALLSGCAAATTPGDLRAQADGATRFQFSQTAASVKTCLVPALDKIKPFTLNPGTRPPSVRELGDKLEIFAQDETITLYVIDLNATGPRSSQTVAYAKTMALLDQLGAAARSCGGSPG